MELFFWLNSHMRYDCEILTLTIDVEKEIQQRHHLYFALFGNHAEWWNGV